MRGRLGNARRRRDHGCPERRRLEHGETVSFRQRRMNIRACALVERDQAAFVEISDELDTPAGARSIARNAENVIGSGQSQIDHQTRRKPTPRLDQRRDVRHVPSDCPTWRAAWARRLPRPCRASKSSPSQPSGTAAHSFATNAQIRDEILDDSRIGGEDRRRATGDRLARNSAVVPLRAWLAELGKPKLDEIVDGEHERSWLNDRRERRAKIACTWLQAVAAAIKTASRLARRIGYRYGRTMKRRARARSAVPAGRSLARSCACRPTCGTSSARRARRRSSPRLPMRDDGILCRHSAASSRTPRQPSRQPPRAKEAPWHPHERPERHEGLPERALNVRPVASIRV